jgi:hypothetical protein
LLVKLGPIRPFSDDVCAAGSRLKTFDEVESAFVHFDTKAWSIGNVDGPVSHFDTAIGLRRDALKAPELEGFRPAH